MNNKINISYIPFNFVMLQFVIILIVFKRICYLAFRALCCLCQLSFYSVACLLFTDIKLCHYMLYLLYCKQTQCK